MITKSWTLHGISLRELVPNLKADGLNAAGSKLWLGGIEATAVDSHHLHDHRINTALRDSHQVYQGCLHEKGVTSALLGRHKRRSARRWVNLQLWTSIWPETGRIAMQRVDLLGDGSIYGVRRRFAETKGGGARLICVGACRLLPLHQSTADTWACLLPTVGTRTEAAEEGTGGTGDGG
uniref:Uncharacterized protein n=1 Tax=Zea mays TaxID=4577 RepID=C0PII8_MAIZE|nr:unknown [Zea mays]